MSFRRSSCEGSSSIQRIVAEDEAGGDKGTPTDALQCSKTIPSSGACSQYSKACRAFRHALSEPFKSGNVAHQFPSVNTLVPFTESTNVPNLDPIQRGVLYGVLLGAQKRGHVAHPALVSLSDRRRGKGQDSGAKALNRSGPSGREG